MKRIRFTLFFISIYSCCSQDRWELVCANNTSLPKNGWVLIRKGDLVPPSPLASLQQKLASGRPLLDSYREFNPGAPLKQLAREIEERRSWERYLLRDRWRRWVKSVVVYGGFVAKVLPEIAAGISELQSR